MTPEWGMRHQYYIQRCIVESYMSMIVKGHISRIMGWNDAYTIDKTLALKSKS